MSDAFGSNSGGEKTGSRLNLLWWGNILVATAGIGLMFYNERLQGEPSALPSPVGLVLFICGMIGASLIRNHIVVPHGGKRK